jgi:hypothetical protein
MPIRKKVGLDLSIEASKKGKENMRDDMTEAKAAATLGVTEKDIAAIRKNLFQGEHWARKGKLIVWMEQGLERAKELLGLKAEMARPASVALPGPVSDRSCGIVEMTVKKLCRNPRLFIAVDKGGVEYPVRIRNAKNLRPGIIVNIRVEPACCWYVGRPGLKK